MPVRTFAALLTSAGLAAAAAPAATVVPPGHPAEGHTLTVVVSEATTPGGTIGTALFASAEGFPDGNAPAAAQLHPHTTAAADTFVFRNVAPGRYAVAVQHDINGNGKVDRSMVGSPKEPWGVSRDVRHTFRAPRFDEAAFELRGDMRIDVRVAK